MLKKRATINETSISSEPEQSAPKKGKTQKQGKTKTPEVAIEFDKEGPPQSSTFRRIQQETKVQSKNKPMK